MKRNTITVIGENGRFETKRYFLDDFETGENVKAATMLSTEFGSGSYEKLKANHIKSFTAISSNKLPTTFFYDMDTNTYHTSLGALWLDRLIRHKKIAIDHSIYVLDIDPDIIEALHNSIADFITKAVNSIVDNM